jgi:hypothetical protein
LFTGRERFAQCCEDNGRWGKVFGYDAPKLWCWRRQREQQTTMRGRTRSRLNNDANREGLQKKLTGYPHACSQSIRIQKSAPLGCGKTHVVYLPEQPEPTWLWNVHTQIAERGHASCVTGALRLLASNGITRYNSPLASAGADSQGVMRLCQAMMQSYPKPLPAVNRKYIDPVSYWPPEVVVYLPRPQAT